MLNLLNPSVRKQIIEETQGNENVERKKQSFIQSEVYKDRIYQPVKKYLEPFYSEKTINETPIIASVNLARRIVNKEASLYCREPERKFYGLTDAQIELIKQVYDDMKIDTIMQRINQNYKLENQTHCYIVPRAGKLKMIPMMAYQLDVVPSSADSEIGEVYLVNGFDRIAGNVQVTTTGDSTDEMIADEDDYKKARKAISVWSPMFNFIMDEEGNIINTEDTSNPIGGVVPFVDVFSSKDSEYWVRIGQSVTDFTIQYNAALTDMSNIVRMQGFGQAWLKSGPDQKMQNVQIGPNKILHLPTDPNGGQSAEFGYANANPDLSGSLSYIEGLLSSFLTSRGVDPKTVNAKGEAMTYTSGLDRLLAMVEQFEATEADTEVMECAERQILKIVIAYLNTYAGTPVLPNYPSVTLPLDATVDVEFQKPTAIQSDSEKLANIQMRLELGLIDQIDAIAEDRNIDREEAQVIFDKMTGVQSQNNQQSQDMTQQDG
ncbi:MAG TPA: hypothetical protein PK522_00900 [Nitrosomonas sp.]|nr:hypothetical protein [Nitrosomonas sp.]